jgi:hypothetical protein
LCLEKEQNYYANSVYFISLQFLTVFKEAWSEKTNRNFFGDKIYNNQDFFTELEKEKKSIMMTPIKGIKDQCQEIKK